jgi:hypothetical protein
MSADALELNAVNKDGWAGSSGKTLTTTQITSLKHTSNFKPRNALLVRHLDGYREVTDSGLISSYGRGGGFLELGSTNSATEIDRVAGANIDDLGQPMVTTEVSYDDTTATYRPWLDIDLFKTVTVPGLDTSTIVPVVNTVTVADGGDGAPVFSLELGAVKDDPETRLARALRRTIGSLNGRSLSAAPAQPFRPVLVPPIVETNSWGGSGTPDTTVMSPPWFPHYTHRTLRVTIGRDAGTTAMTVTVYKNGSSVGTVSTSATGTAAFAYFTSSVTGGTDYLQAKVTTAGTGSTNPSVVIEAM